MPNRSEDQQSTPPQIELRFGGVHVTVRRIPAWLVSLAASSAAAGFTWWVGR